MLGGRLQSMFGRPSLHLVAPDIWNGTCSDYIEVFLRDMEPMRFINRRSLILIFFVLVEMSSFPANADGKHSSPPSFGDSSGFTERDRQIWHHGRWYHVRHDGQFGWWWVVPGLKRWYLYKSPTFPDPNPFARPIAMNKGPAPVPKSNVSSPGPHYLYYCGSENGYYPYVATCPEHWERVPAIPPGARTQ